MSTDSLHRTLRASAALGANSPIGALIDDASVDRLRGMFREPLFASRACRHDECKARIVWTVTSTGGRMPVDAAEVADGNVIVVKGDDGEPHATVFAPGAKVERPQRPHLRTVSHFATCVAPAEFRGKRR